MIEHHSQILTSAAEAFVDQFSLTGHYYNHVTLCAVYAAPAYGYLWVPSLAFDAVLAVLAVWAGILHSRQQHSGSMGLGKSRLVNILIQGNVIYFIRCEFSCSYSIRSEYSAVPLSHFFYIL